MANPKNPRRRTVRWIRPDLQFRGVFSCWICATIGLLIFFHCALLGLSRLSRSEIVDIDALYGTFGDVLLWSFFAACAGSVLFGTLLGLQMLFPFAGPLYRFKQHLLELRRGKWSATCRIRKGDNLHDLKDVINEAFTDVLQTVRSQHRLLEDFLEHEDQTQRDQAGDVEAPEKLIERARALNDTVRERLGLEAKDAKDAKNGTGSPTSERVDEVSSTVPETETSGGSETNVESESAPEKETVDA